MYKSGSIVIGTFPYTNFVGLKKRPMLVIEKVGEDYLVVPITSKLHQFYAIELQQKDILAGTLLTQSYLRFHRMTLIHNSIIHKQIGAVKNQLTRMVKERFIKEVMKRE